MNGGASCCCEAPSAMGLVLQSGRPLLTCEGSFKPVWGVGIETAEGNGVSGWEEVVGVHVDDSSGRFGCEGKVKNSEGVGDGEQT